MTMTPDESISPAPAAATRRDLLKCVALLAAGIGVQNVSRFVHPVSAAALDSRTVAGGRFAVELDGVLLELIKSAEGGFPRADVVHEKL